MNRSIRRSTTLGLVFGALLPMPASAASLPRPQSDFEATIRIWDSQGIIRHHGTHLLIQYAVGERQFWILIDSDRQIATIMGERDGNKIAMEVPAAILSPDGIVPSKDGAAHIVGNATVAGEACEIWRHVEDNPWPYKGAPKQIESESCFTQDGILLRTTTIDRKEPRLEVNELKRRPQDGSLFAVPPEYELYPFHRSE